jgi:ABC-type transport system involved in multi-copper enzyme maturation permease subunit
MFGTVAAFELRYQLRNPVFVVAAVMLFLLTFAGTTAPSIRLGSGGAIHSNAPTAVAQVQLLMSILAMFMTTAFVGGVVVRDDETNFASIIRSTMIGKLAYMFGRFGGAFLGAALAFLAVPLAIWIGTFMPWVDPENLGPNRLQDYLFGYFVLALPNLLITSAIFFAIATWTRSLTYSYLAVILFMVAYVALTSALRKLPDLTLPAYFEPFGSIAYSLAIRYLNPSESNAQPLQLTALLLGNRLLWVAISAAVVAVAVWRFRFATRGASKRSVARQAARERKLAAVRPVLVDRLPVNRPEKAARRQLLTRTLLEMKLVIGSPAFWVLAIVGSINLFLTLNLAKLFYGVPIWPRTFAVVDTVRNASAMITLLMAIYFSGEVVWRERERRINEIVDATPTPTWVFLVSKLAGVVGALLALVVAVVLVQSVVFQIVRGVTDVELVRWLAWFAAPSALYVVHLSVLTIVVQALSPNKFVGWGVMLLYLVATVALAGVGFAHPLLNYAEVPMPLSDMNGAEYGGETGWWLRAYWTAIALVLVVVGHLMWRRGTAVTLAGQWRILPARLHGKPRAFLGAALTVAFGLGGFLFYNMNIRNDFPDRTETERRLARYEQRYSRYVDLPQPTLTDVNLKVDLHPSRGDMYVQGAYRFTNQTPAAIDTLHVRMTPGVNTPLRAVYVSGAKLVEADRENQHLIYRFERPLQPGASGTASFQTAVVKRGLAALPDPLNYEIDAQPATNGSYVVNYQILPILGMSRMGFLEAKSTRAKYGLAPAPEAPQLEDRSAQAENYAGLERVRTDVTVTTDADQTLVATGARVSDTVVDGRRTARFVSPIPSINFITIQSARYSVKTADSGGVKLEVYYHPEHPRNVDRMLSAMDASLDYYRTNFGPYPYPYARIVERPAYGGGANSAAGTIGYSELVGFIMDPDEPTTGVDFLSYLTAHELAHQYWFHQLMPADMEGAELLTEGLAQYSALMVMKHRHGPDQIRRFLKYELDQYLQGRRMEAGNENPLARVRHQGYIHYNKASLVMYLLQDRLGEERVNAILRDLLDRYRFKPAPYARASDLVDGFLSLARTPAERELVLDQFHRITLYDLKATAATVRLLPNGQFETTVTIDASKFYSTRGGSESPAPFNELVDIGLFTRQPGARGFGSADVVSIERMPIRSGEQQVRLVSRRKPVYAGIDPYLGFIDRNSADNIARATDRGV